MKRFWPLALKKIIAYKNENAGYPLGNSGLKCYKDIIGFLLRVFGVVENVDS